MKKAQGFTLIELIIVIIILGILAVTAAPKFINMQDDARQAQIKGLKGAISGAMVITNGKAALQGDEKKAAGDTVKVGNTLIAFGYPKATVKDLQESAGFSGDDFTTVASGTAGTVYLHSAALTYATASDVATGKCYITYVEATLSAAATVVLDDDKC